MAIGGKRLEFLGLENHLTRPYCAYCKGLETACQCKCRLCGKGRGQCRCSGKDTADEVRRRKCECNAGCQPPTEDGLANLEKYARVFIPHGFWELRRSLMNTGHPSVYVGSGHGLKWCLRCDQSTTHCTQFTFIRRTPRTAPG